MQGPRQCIGHDNYTCSEVIKHKNGRRCPECAKAYINETLRAKRAYKKKLRMKELFKIEEAKKEAIRTSGLGKYDIQNLNSFVSLDGVLEL